ncbi:hypothetical protein MLD38_028783 [Melastoma candidum]|uniref:Uncharacterized protein n=1 Tax=Melastoma candidum TaxID=119954 RepID=A0ACB9N3C7_9MYRT|nr:hypothetical protein MLD38_028783 [Melastoma candidum]
MTRHITGRAYKLRGVCGNDEGGDGLEEGVKAVLLGEIQQPELDVNERRVKSTAQENETGGGEVLNGPSN